MIGIWQRFGEGEPPRDGEGLVYIRDGGSVIDALEGHGSEVVFAVYRYGSLHGQGGSIYSPPYGAMWTSLPHPTETREARQSPVMLRHVIPI